MRETVIAVILLVTAGVTAMMWESGMLAPARVNGAASTAGGSPDVTRFPGSVVIGARLIGVPGTDPKGMADSTSALNKAIAAAPDNTIIELLPGTYKVSTLTIAHPIRLWMYGATLQGNGRDPVVTVGHIPAIPTMGIYGGTIDCGASGPVAGNFGIVMSDVLYSPTLRDVTVYHCGDVSIFGDGNFFTGEMDNVKVRFGWNYCLSLVRDNYGTNQIQWNSFSCQDSRGGVLLHSVYGNSFYNVDIEAGGSGKPWAQSNGSLPFINFTNTFSNHFYGGYIEDNDCGKDPVIRTADSHGDGINGMMISDNCARGTRSSFVDLQKDTSQFKLDSVRFAVGQGREIAIAVNDDGRGNVGNVATNILEVYNVARHGSVNKRWSSTGSRFHYDTQGTDLTTR